MFSRYYTGFATYTVFRVAETIFYSSPEFNSFFLAAAHAGIGGKRRSTAPAVTIFPADLGGQNLGLFGDNTEFTLAKTVDKTTAAPGEVIASP